MDVTNDTGKSKPKEPPTALLPKEATASPQSDRTHENPHVTRPDTQMKQPTKGSNKWKWTRKTFNGMLEYLNKEEKKTLKKKRSKKVTRPKEPFFIDPIYGPVTSSPDRTPPMSPGVFDGEISREPTPSDTGSPSSTKNHRDSNGKSNSEGWLNPHQSTNPIPPSWYA